MSFLAKLELDGKPYNILDCSFDFDQSFDQNGEPSSRPKGGMLLMSIEMNSDTSLFHWMISPTLTKSGAVIFYKRDGMAQLLKIEFTDAYCVHLSGRFDAVSKEPLKIQIRISAQSIKIGDVEFENHWNMVSS